MSAPIPVITDTNRPYWEGLSQGRLRFQHCANCGNDWLPPRANCPRCLAAEPKWRDASGKAKVVSWVVYHTAYADHLKVLVPYDVTLVELREGPRLLTNVTNSEAGKRLREGVPVVLSIEIVDGTAIPRFKLQTLQES